MSESYPYHLTNINQRNIFTRLKPIHMSNESGGSVRQFYIKSLYEAIAHNDVPVANFKNCES